MKYFLFALRHNLCGVMFGFMGCSIMLIVSFGIRPDDPTVMVSLACGSISGIASSTGE